MARRRRGPPPPPSGDPGAPRPGEVRRRRARELGGPVGRADVEHQSKRGASGRRRRRGWDWANKGPSFARRDSKGALGGRGGGGSGAVEADVLPASPPMASTGSKLEIRIDWIAAVGSCKSRGF
jgi:hypothetical protein